MPLENHHRVNSLTLRSHPLGRHSQCLPILRHRPRRHNDRLAASLLRRPCCISINVSQRDQLSTRRPRDCVVLPVISGRVLHHRWPTIRVDSSRRELLAVTGCGLVIAHLSFRAGWRGKRRVGAICNHVPNSGLVASSARPTTARAASSAPRMKLCTRRFMPVPLDLGRLNMRPGGHRRNGPSRIRSEAFANATRPNHFVAPRLQSSAEGRSRPQSRGDCRIAPLDISRQQASAPPSPARTAPARYSPR